MFLLLVRNLVGQVRLLVFSGLIDSTTGSLVQANARFPGSVKKQPVTKYMDVIFPPQATPPATEEDLVAALFTQTPDAEGGILLQDTVYPICPTIGDEAEFTVYSDGSFTFFAADVEEEV